LPRAALVTKLFYEVGDRLETLGRLHGLLPYGRLRDRSTMQPCDIRIDDPDGAFAGCPRTDVAFADADTIAATAGLYGKLR
jgi:hypothetical protein